ncbi:ISL3 family transposase [Methylosinus sp. LW3]|uniref:ISL3 family transposase n=1 Tax=Methylosinus sp. LW3 TaxID=107635 RepID=UPI0004642DDD|nr:ISL3 family transposase [Methylosinus sp. LW3]
MTTALRPSAIIPSGFRVDRVSIEGEMTTIEARAIAATRTCPDCGSISRRVHSHYSRRLSDLPLAGRVGRISLTARRFRCMTPTCRRSIFTERFGDDIIAARARRTARLENVVHHLALALGGRSAAGRARRLMMPVSNDTLLRVVRRGGRPSPPPPTVIGIDDWAWKRNRRYGAIICDLGRHRPIKLLPDREPATAQAWLAGQPQIAIVARDRGGGFALAASRALPGALQVADRWHLMENASAAFLGAVRKSMRCIRSALGATFVDPALLTAAEKLQYEGYLRREEVNAAIFARAERGASIKEIVRETGNSRGLVRKILRGQRSEIFRTRESSLEPHLPWLDAQWAAGCHNGAELWRRLQAAGFRGSLRVVSEWAGRRRRSEKMDAAGLHRTPSARTIARLMTSGRDALSTTETLTIAAIEDSVPALVEARAAVAAFQATIRKKAGDDLDGWIDRAKTGLLASFASGVTKDRAAVVAAITNVWSNGQTEGQITRLKLIKRQMYGRAKLDLLEARLLGAD